MRVCDLVDGSIAMLPFLGFVDPDWAGFLIDFLVADAGFFAFEALSEALMRVIFVPDFDADGFATISDSPKFKSLLGCRLSSLY